MSDLNEEKFPASPENFKIEKLVPKREDLYKTKITCWKTVNTFVIETDIDDLDAETFRLEITIVLEDEQCLSRKRIDYPFAHKSDALLMKGYFDQVFTAGRMFARLELKHWLNEV